MSCYTGAVYILHSFGIKKCRDEVGSARLRVTNRDISGVRSAWGHFLCLTSGTVSVRFGDFRKVAQQSTEGPSTGGDFAHFAQAAARHLPKSMKYCFPGEIGETVLRNDFRLSVPGR